MTVKQLQDFLRKVVDPEHTEILFDIPEYDFLLESKEIEYSQSCSGDIADRLIFFPETEE